MARARVTAKGQITVPKEVRERLHIGRGDELEFRFSGDRLEVVPVRKRSIKEFFGIFRRDGVPERDWDEEREIAWRARAQEILQDAPAGE